MNLKGKAIKQMIEYVTRYAGHPAISESRIIEYNKETKTVSYYYDPHEDDAIIDEEEEGSAETSNNREIEEQEDIYISKKLLKGYGELSTSLLMKYQKMISKRYEQVKATGDSFINRDDLNFFSLSMFAAMEICYLNKFHYKCNRLFFNNWHIIFRRILFHFHYFFSHIIHLF